MAYIKNKFVSVPLITQAYPKYSLKSQIAIKKKVETELKPAFSTWKKKSIQLFLAIFFFYK